MKASELTERLQMLITVYGDLDVKLWPFKDQGNYKDPTVIVVGIDHKVFLIDEDYGLRKEYDPMPITKNIDKEKNLTVFKITGTVSFDEFRDVIIDYYESGATDMIILDLKEAKGGGKTFPNERISELANFLEEVRKGRNTGKTAFVATKDVLFGICKTLENYMGNSKIKYGTFRTMDEAIEWIEGS
jgi:hypothetical protein